VLAVALPPADQIFEKWCPLENVKRFDVFSAIFTQDASRGAASGGSDF